MKNENDHIIDVEDRSTEDTRPTEVPQISIESDNSDRDAVRAAVPMVVEENNAPARGQKNLWVWAIAIPTVIILTIAALWIAGILKFSSVDPSARKVTEQNIEKLSYDYQPSAKGTIQQTDSILGVDMDMYPLEGLRASLEGEFPDTADSSLVLFMRSADYHPDGRSLGPVVVDGISTENKAIASRDGYILVSASGRPAIGISQDETPEKWAKENKGDFFRQMVLLDDGQLPREFLLKGKVERCAIASDVEGKLYYIVTRRKESMYDFADAMREYGFVNAVYITGGNGYSFYRDPAGHAHMNQPTLEKIEKYTIQPLPQPLLVFRNK